MINGKIQRISDRSLRLVLTATIAASTASCSFIELHPGARNIILANDNSCELVDTFEAAVPVKNAFIGRTPEAISEELQILAQNAAFDKRANAIWPTTKVIEGKQTFSLLRCKR